MSDNDKMDVGGTLALIEELEDLVKGLDGERPNIEVSNKDVMRRKAEVQRKLLYAAHLADCVKVDITSHYHRFKGQTTAPRVV